MTRVKIEGRKRVEILDEQQIEARQYVKHVINVAAYAGEIMLRSGAETSRVEETMNSFIHSFGIKYSQSISTPTGIYLSADNDAMLTPLTLVRRVRSRALHFKRIAEVNDLSRRAVLGQVTLAEAERELHQIETAPDPYPFWVWLVAGSGAAMGVTILLGGGILEAAVAFGSSIFLQLLIWLLIKVKIPAIFGEFFGAALVTFLALLVSWAGLPIVATLVIAGGLTKLVPGAALLASVQDGISGDLLSSAARGLEAFLKGAAIASGVGLALRTAQALGITISLDETAPAVWQIPIQVAAAGFGCACFGISNRAPTRAIFGMLLCGGLCVFSHTLLLRSTNADLLATFLAAIAVTMLGWGLARWQHMPVIVYILPGVLPLLPGITIYRGMFALTQSRNVDGLLLLAQAIFLGGAIAAGVALANTIAPNIWKRPHLPHF